MPSYFLMRQLLLLFSSGDTKNERSQNPEREKSKPGMGEVKIQGYSKAMIWESIPFPYERHFGHPLKADKRREVFLPFGLRSVLDSSN